MPAGPSTTHRRGRSTSYLSRAKARTAPIVALVAAAADRTSADTVGRQAMLTVRTSSGQAAMLPAQIGDFEVAALLPTRRPPSFKDMRSYIGRASVTVDAGTTPVWFESLNELSHIRDIAMTNDLVAMASQPALVTWDLGDGVRHHYPDLLHVDRSGLVVLTDVTRSAKLTKPSALAQFVLTSATARAAGWRYEVRTEMPAQRVRNIAHLHACRFGSLEESARHLESIREGGLPRQLHQIVRNAGGAATTVDILHLVATKRLFLDLDQPITEATMIREQPNLETPPWLHTIA